MLIEIEKRFGTKIEKEKIIIFETFYFKISETIDSSKQVLIICRFSA
jgi:hypothetical protein